MPSKRHSGITKQEALLSRVVSALESDDGALEREAEARSVVAAYRTALRDLLSQGPLLCSEAVLRELESRTQLTPPDVINLRAELLQFVRSAVRGGQVSRPSSPVTTAAQVSFDVQWATRSPAVIGANGTTRDLVVVQFVLLIQEVGLHSVRECSATDCRRLYVKVYRREFCSPRCQKRINTRKQRQHARERLARDAQRRRQRRKQGDRSNG